MSKNDESRTPSSEPRAPIVARDEDGMRLDRWFKRHFSQLTHGHLQKLLRTGQVRINGKRAEASDRLAEGQSLRLPPQLLHGGFDAPVAGGKVARPVRNSARLRSLVLYEDDDVIALNKPAGLAVQGGTGLKENLDDSLMIFSRDGTTKPKLVHRLDRDTSGVLLLARNDYAARKLTAAFRERDTQKIYWAVTVGVPKRSEGRIDLPLLKQGERMVPVADKKFAQRDRVENAAAGGGATKACDAVTLYRVVESVAGQAAFVALRPVTGRTHQLRAHMASLGTPILGDRLYGGEVPEGLPHKELGRGLHLHARQLVIPHPQRGIMDVVAPLGPEMCRTWDWFGFGEDAEFGIRGSGFGGWD